MLFSVGNTCYFWVKTTLLSNTDMQSKPTDSPSHSPASASLDRAFDSELFRETGHQLIDLLADQLGKSSRREGQAIPYRAPEEELAFWQEDFRQNQGKGSLDLFEKILDHSIRVHDPRVMGHQVATPAMLAAFGGLISDLLSNGTAVYEMGMASNALEKVLTDFLAAEIGFDEEAGGFLTSGGTLANLTALLAAREAKAPSNVWSEGHSEKLAVMVSEEAHYCIDRAARIMGMGTEGIIKVPVDEAYRIRTDLMEAYLHQAQEKGLHVIAVIGCAASTATGSYDDLEGLAAFSRKNNLWFHVDGAHGGGAALSPRYAYLTKGMEQADSLVIDFHKLLLTPALTTALIYRRGQEAYRTFQQKAQYLWEEQQTEEWYNSGKRTFECTKLMMATKVYIIVRTFGKEIFEANLNRLYDLARQFARMIQSSEDFELALEPQSNIINYRYVNGEEDSLDELNSRIRQALIESGDYYIVQTSLKGKKYLRSAIMNPMSNQVDFQGLLDRIAELGQRFNAK